MTDDNNETAELSARVDYYMRKDKIMRGNAHANLTFIARQNEDMLRALGALGELNALRNDLRALREEAVRELRGLRHDVQFGFFAVLVFLGYHLWRLYFS